MPKKQVATPPPTQGRTVEPSTATRSSRSLEFTAESELEDYTVQTPAVSSNDSELDTEATPTMDKGKRPVSDNDAATTALRQPFDQFPANYMDHFNILMDTVRRQNEDMAEMRRMNEDLRRELNGGPAATSPVRAPTPSEDEVIQKQVDRYEKKATLILGQQSKVLLRSNNYKAWRESFIISAEAIQAREILDAEEKAPPTELTKQESAIWKAKYEILLRHLISTISTSVSENLQGLDRTDLFAIWNHYKARFGMSLAQERLLAVKAFRDLTIQGNNYGDALVSYRKLVMQLKSLNTTWEDFAHDTFFLMLKDYKKAFVDMQLDDFFADSRSSGKITNVDLEKLQEALLIRANEGEKSSKKEKENAPKANEASTQDFNTSGKKTEKVAKSKGRKEGVKGSYTGPKCYYCNGIDHIESKCRFKYPDTATEEFRNKWASRIQYLKQKHSAGNTDSERQTVPNQPSMVANSAIVMSSMGNTSPTADWFLDTCASFHMCPNRDAFISYKPYTGTRIRVANETFAEPVGIGKIIIEIDDGVLELDDVRHVPSFGTNLVSYGQLDDQGFGLSVSANPPRYHIITSPQGDTFFAHKTEVSNVYKIGECAQIGNRSFSTAYSSISAPDISSVASFQAGSLPKHSTPKSEPPKCHTMTLMEWHQRLVHLNAADILKLAKDPKSGVAIKGSKTLGFCEVCQQAKQTRKVSHTPMPRATRPLTRIHVDIAGGGNTFGNKDQESTTSRQGSNYYMPITDDATRYRWVFFLNRKSDALPVLKWWIQWMENQGFSPPAFIRMDNELVTNEMKEFCLSKGIKLEPTNPHSPWQDSVSERSIRTISDLSRAAFIDSGLPKKLWADCVECTSLILNNVPTSTVLYNDSTPGTTSLTAKPSPYSVPASAWFGTPPELLHFRKWGSPLTYHLHGSAKPEDKLSARAKKGFLIGYNGKNIYRIWDPNSDTILTSSDVRFNEQFHDGTASGSQIQGGAPTQNNNGIAQTGRASHMVNPSSRPVAAATITAGTPIAAPELSADLAPKAPNTDTGTLPQLRFEVPRESDIELDPTFVWYRPAKGFKSFALAAKLDHTSHGLPGTYRQAVTGPEAAQWIPSMEKELQQLMDKRSWNLVLRADLSKDQKILLGRWVFRKKVKDDGTILFKSRWVVRGDMMRDYSGDGYETYSPVVDATTTRILFAAAAHKGWTILQADAVLAFLNGRLPSPVYMIQPTGFEKGEKGTLVCEVVQALYGLTTSPRIWYDTVVTTMESLAFRVSPYDPSLWISTTRKHLYVTAHVDDFKFVCENPDDGHWAIEKLGQHFEIKSLGKIKHYLGMDIAHSEKGLTLSQKAYIDDLLESFGMSDCRPAHTPLNEGTLIDDLPDPSINIAEYQRGVGSLQYLSDKTRPDIARAASFLAEYNNKPTPKCWNALKHVLHYLAGSRERGIVYESVPPNSADTFPMPTCHTDSDWAGTLTDRRRSVGGYIFLLANGPISWKSKKQTCTATSSNEAEYVAASEATRQATWIRRLMGDMGLFDPDSNLPPIPVMIDSSGAKSLVKSTMGTKRSKHIDIRYHYTREAAAMGVITIHGIPSKENAADGFTKLLNRDGFDRFLNLSRMK